MNALRLRIIHGIVLAILLLPMLAIAVAAADPVVAITVAKWHEAPYAPTNLAITQLGASSINMTWIPGLAANITIVRGSTSGYPFSIFDGSPVYSGNGTYVVVEGLSLSDTTHYFRAWCQNEYGTSSGYAQASIGPEGIAGTDVSALTAMIVSLIEGPIGVTNIMFAVSLMGFGFWKKSWIRVILALSLIIWGVFAMPYDIKIAAPFVGIGAILFMMGIFQAIASYREARSEAI